MITVIIAGGSGTRLWPLSTSDYPKHLLSLTNEKSLLQNTVERVERVAKQDRIFVITEQSHADHVRTQMSDLPKENILVEPARRGTASCFLMALNHISSLGLPSDEPILFLWADHLIRDNDGFAAAVLRAGELSKEESRLVFIGVEPTYPATGMGYMQKNGEVAGWYNAFYLKQFKEKPDKETAEEYFNSGDYLWNTGYLVGSVNTFKLAMSKAAPELLSEYEKLAKTEDLQKSYLELSNKTIDNALSEHVDDGIVIPGTFDWVDVGSFGDLYAVSKTNSEGNHIWGEKVVLENTTNSYVRNESDVPVAVIGLDNIVVVNTSKGILVANKTFAQKVGDVAKKIQS